MTNSAQKYADRLIDTICDCLRRCHAAPNPLECAEKFVTRLRANAAWQQSDADRVERAVMRMVRPPESIELKQRA